MLNIKLDRLEQSAELLKAMAHPQRLHLLYALMPEEQCVCHLTALLHERQPYVSQQLSYLRDAGLLADRKAGLRVYYRIADERIVPLLRTLAAAPEIESLLHDCECPRCTSIHSPEETC